MANLFPITIIKLLLFFITSGLELNASRSRNVIYFSVIAMPKKSHFTFLAIQNFVQNTTKHTRIPLLGSYL